MIHPLIVLEIALFLGACTIQAQSGKGGGGFSKFRESINSVQRQQQQQVPPIPKTSSQSFQQTLVNNQLIQQQPVPVQTSKQVVEQVDTTFDSSPHVYGQVDGKPGIDFPSYTSIPNTGFSCNGVPFEPGMYADESTGCQVYHICYQGRKESFLCGVGTVFNQAILGCDFWHSVDCSRSSQYYHLNADLGKASAEPSGIQKTLTNQQINSFNLNQLNQVKLSKPSSKTSSYVKESFSKVDVPQPQPAHLRVNSRVESSSNFRSSGTVPQLSGKTSLRQQSFNTGSLLSPGRKLQVTNSFDQNGGQFASESSNYMKVASNSQAKPGLIPQTGTKTSKSNKASSNQTTNNSSEKSASLNEDQNKNGPVVSKETSAWKPYFKRKQQTSTETTTTTTATELPTVPSTTLGRPDKEPNFSDEGQSDAEPKFRSSSDSSELKDGKVTTPTETSSSRAPLSDVPDRTSTVSESTETNIESPVTTVTEPPPSATSATSTGSSQVSTTSSPESTLDGGGSREETTTTTSAPSTGPTESQPSVRSADQSSVEYAKET